MTIKILISLTNKNVNSNTDVVVNQISFFVQTHTVYGWIKLLLTKSLSTGVIYIQREVLLNTIICESKFLRKWLVGVTCFIPFYIPNGVSLNLILFSLNSILRRIHYVQNTIPIPTYKTSVRLRLLLDRMYFFVLLNYYFRYRKRVVSSKRKKTGYVCKG